MSVRRRQIRERLERNRRWETSSFNLRMEQIRAATEAAMARGEVHVTDRFLIEAFGPLANDMQRRP